MTPKERQAAIDELKTICHDIGCSGLHPVMCNEQPQNCGIIRKIMVFVADGQPLPPPPEATP